MKHLLTTITIALIFTFVVGCGYKKNCDFVLPHQYFLVKDSITNRYAIMFLHLDTYRYYLASNIIPFEKRYSRLEGAADAETFSDSCEAKGFAVAAIQYINRKNSNRFK